MVKLDNRPEIASVADRVKPVSAEMGLVAAYFVGESAAFVGAEEAVLLVDADGAHSRVIVHGGGILCSAGDGRRIVTGGDDGNVVEIEAGGTSNILARDARRRWIDNVALHGDGAVAWSAGKTTFTRSGKGEEKSLDVASTVGGLAFAPRGFRLAVAHYNGVTLWFPNMSAAPQSHEWKGSHLAVTFSPDGKFLVTGMHEPSLHGWRLADGRDMRMSGYPARVRSVSWSAGGKWLATSGADSVIAWPFQSKDGPMGKTPQMLAPSRSLVSAVACHPQSDIVATGFADGSVLLARLGDGAEISVRPAGGAAIAALAWNARGTMLALAAADGEAGLLTL